MNGTVLQLVTEAKYTGILLDSKLTFKSHKKNCARRLDLFLEMYEMATIYLLMQLNYIIPSSHVNFCVPD